MGTPAFSARSRATEKNVSRLSALRYPVAELTMLDTKGLGAIELVGICQFDVLRYFTSIASGLGPTQTIPAFPTSLAKSAFSDKKP